MTDFLIPGLIAFVLLYGLSKGVNLSDAMLCGAKSGMRTCLSIFPTLVTMLAAVTMLRASGAIDLLSCLLSPLTDHLGIPAECVPLALLRPFSGSGALSVGSSVMQQCGVDSFAGRTAAVMLGSSETSFYVLSVYSAHLGLKQTHYALPAALCADAAAFLLSGLFVRLLMGT